MSMRALVQKLTHRWRAEEGSVTVEFVIIVPFVLSIFLMGVDSGVTQLRQAFLYRAVDMAVREVRLGTVNEAESLSKMICARTAMLPNCENAITVEMQPIDTSTFSGLDAPTLCINHEEELTPAIAFNPGAGGQAQELMLIRVCVVTKPFIRLTGFLTALPVNDEGDYVLTARNVFVNEPR